MLSQIRIDFVIFCNFAIFQSNMDCACWTNKVLNLLFFVHEGMNLYIGGILLFSFFSSNSYIFFLSSCAFLTIANFECGSVTGKSE